MIYISYKILKYLILRQWQWMTGKIFSVNVLFVIVNIFNPDISCHKVFYLLIVGHKLHRFFYSFHYCCEQRGKFSFPIWLITFFYNETGSIFLMHSHSYFNTHLQYNHVSFYPITNTLFNFIATRFVVEKSPSKEQ